MTISVISFCSSCFRFYFWRKKRFLICIFIGCVMSVIFMRNICNFRILNSWVFAHLTQMPEAEVLDKMRKTGTLVKPNSEGSSLGCGIPSLLHRIESNTTRQKNTVHDRSCKRIPPLRGTCTLARNLFGSQEKPSCLHQQKIEICRLKELSWNKAEVLCDFSLCSEPVLLGTVSSTTGVTEWEKADTPTDLQRTIMQIIDGKSKANFGFCFIRCAAAVQRERLSDGYIDTDSIVTMAEFTQLFILPPKRTLRFTRPSQLFKTNTASIPLNFNLIFVDSVSRHHFYRSLPQTIQVMESINVAKKCRARVLDFRLLQSIRSRTFENLEALLSGYVNPAVKPFGVMELSPEPLNVKKMFGLLKQKQYTTLWLEDLCYNWEWGLSKDLHVFNRSLSGEEMWARLTAALYDSNIDSVDVMLASCPVLEENGVHDPFHGPNAICFNGRHQHEYMFEYLMLYQKQKVVDSQPFFSMFMLNLGHEDTGKRIQLADHSLATYVEFVSRLSRTLTIIVADHGNAYGKFIDQSQEAQIELHHPALFMIVPDTVAEYLGQQRMESLIVNQERLVSLLDIHYALMSLIQPGYPVSDLNKQFDVTASGLFSPISSVRTCANIPRIMPSLCICQGFDTAVENNTYHMTFAHFALGRLNNELQQQFRKHHPQVPSGTGKCQRLELSSVRTIRKSFIRENLMSLKMDLYVYGSHSSSEHPEIILVAMDVELGGGHHMILHKFDRLTSYSKYIVCADEGVSLQLCICDLWSTNKENVHLNRIFVDRQSLGQKNYPGDNYLGRNSFYYLRPVPNYFAHRNYQNVSPPDLSYLGRNALLMKVDVMIIDKSYDCLYILTHASHHGCVYHAANICTNQRFHLLFEVNAIEVEISDEMPLTVSLLPGDITCLAAVSSTKPVSDLHLAYSISLATA